MSKSDFPKATDDPSVVNCRCCRSFSRRPHVHGQAATLKIENRLEQGPQRSLQALEGFDSIRKNPALLAQHAGLRRTEVRHQADWSCCRERQQQVRQAHESWAAIATRLHDRNGKQCRERWRNHLRQLFKGEWTPEEDQEIWDRAQEMGTKWAQISEQYMPSRTDNDIKNRWNSVIRKAHAPGGRELEAAENEMRALFLGSASRTQSRTNLGGIDRRRLRASGEAKKPQSCQSHRQSRPRLPPLAANCLTRRWVSAPMARRCTHPPPHGPSWQTRR